MNSEEITCPYCGSYLPPIGNDKTTFCEECKVEFEFDEARNLIEVKYDKKKDSE